MNSINNFLCENWVNLLLIIVGGFALFTYILQERKKIIEAAALIKLQIDELQKGIEEIDSYIENGQLNNTAFYESQQLFSEDYWSNYKHYFVKKIDAKDFETINKLYEYASEIQEQQILMKNLQKNFFFVNQQVLSNLQSAEALKTISFQNNSQEIKKYSLLIKEKIAATLDEDTSKKVNPIIDAIQNENINQNNLIDSKQQIISLFNQQYFTSYCPQQIQLSLSKYIRKYSLLEIDGTDGYKKIKKISKRKF
ncbi:MAG: hypothetical protein J6B01_12350 [Ruminococcus sp.]|nr:hypothetical protein [Ruminococcus sp.]